MKNFKWTEEIKQEVVRLRQDGLQYKDIANILGCSYNSLKHVGADLVKQGLLDYRVYGISKDKPYRKPKYTEDQILEEVIKWKVAEEAPSYVRSQATSKFGSWTEALKLAGLPPNIGGLLKPNKMTNLYLVDFYDFKKVGITQQTIKKRLSGAPNFTLLDSVYLELEDALNFEKAILQKVIKVIPDNDWFNRNGKTECFIGEYTQLEDYL